MNLLGVKNITTQAAAVGGIVNIGAVYRKFCKRDCSGTTTFSFNGNAINLNQKGIYHLTLTAVVSAPAAGQVNLQLFEDGVAVPGAIGSESITTATTEFHTMTIDYYFIVNSTCVLGEVESLSKAITVVNTGVASTISNIVVNVTKEV